MKKGYIYKNTTGFTGLVEMEILILSDKDHILIKNTYNTNDYKVGMRGVWSGVNWKLKPAFNLYLKLL